METWALQYPFLTFFIVIVGLIVVRCAFKALGGGYWPRKHCLGCDCERSLVSETEDGDA